MRFDSFIHALDMGQCQDQLQRQALFDIALLFVVIDGVVDESEVVSMREWLDTTPWSGSINQDDYYSSTLAKCQHSVTNNEVEDFIRHRVTQLIDFDVKQQALKLANDIAGADGEINAKERRALSFLESLLR